MKTNNAEPATESSAPAILGKTGGGVGYYAMLLALTRSLQDEKEIKKIYDEKGIKYVVTEIGGKSDVDFQDKINRAVLGASLNAHLLSKEERSIHALYHATEEAKRGVLINTTSTSSLAIKIAIVRDEHWISVAIFGSSSIHPLTEHERCGLGIMHI